MSLFAIVLNLILIAIDQITKLMAVAYIKPEGSLTIIEGVFSLTYVENEGAAFGILEGGRWFFVVSTIIILAGIYVYYIKLPKTKEYNKARFAINLISAGAIGNFIDRFRTGRVIDFLQATFIKFPVFNFADCCVVVGTFLLGILVIFFMKEE